MTKDKPRLRVLRHIASDLKRMLNVIDSCTSGDQLLVARNYYLLYLKREPRQTRAFEGQFLSWYALQKVRLLGIKLTSATPPGPEAS